MDAVLGSSATWCSICGVVIDRFQPSFGNPSGYLSWLGEVRGIRSIPRLSKPFLTGVGFLDYHQELSASRDHWRRYDDDVDAQGLAGDRYLERHDVSGLEPCYVVHDACWELLRTRVDPSRALPPNVLARHLFALLYNTPVNSHGTLLPGHDYGGAASFQRPSPHGYFTQVHASNNSYLTGDIREELQQDEHCLWDAVRAASKPFDLPQAIFGNYEIGSDIFCRLPNELVILVLSHLPSQDLVNIRLASRYVADVSSPTALPQEYWASRFNTNQEMGFTFVDPFCLGPEDSGDWRLLYLKSKAALSCSDLFPGFSNRRRVWDILRHVEDAISIRLANEDGVKTEPYESLEVSLDSDLRPTKTVAAEILTGDNFTDDVSLRQLRHSSRLFEIQKLLLPTLTGIRDVRISFSFVFFAGKRYLCGIRSLTSVDGAHWTEHSRAGYINGAREKTMDLANGNPPYAVEMAIGSNGITGVRFTHAPQSSIASLSVGNMITADSGIGIGRIALNCDAMFAGFILGLDACKIVSVALIERFQSVNSAASEADIIKYTPVQDTLLEAWSPGPPSTEVHWIESSLASIKRQALTGNAAHDPRAYGSHDRDLPEWENYLQSALRDRGTKVQQTFSLCVDMDFGGPQGQHLKSLERVVAYMGSYPSVFVGMSFFYIDGSERTFGQKRYFLDGTIQTPAIEQSFFIDGQGGEFIDNWATTLPPSHGLVTRIQFFTNKGRMADFCLRGCDVPKTGLLCKGRWDPNPLTEEFSAMSLSDARMIDQSSVPGDVSRFCAKIKSPEGYFQHFIGFNSCTQSIDESQEIGTPNVMEDKLDIDSNRQIGGPEIDLGASPETLISARDLMGYPGGFAFGAAWLWGLRQIAVSLGKPGSSRSNSNISGLRLDYHQDFTSNGPKSVFLGQWFDEHDTLEVSPDDRIVEMATWHDFVNSHKRAKYGPIIKLFLRTAKGSEKTFLEPIIGGNVFLQYRENPYEGLGGIIWGFNHQWDHVRALYVSRREMESREYQGKESLVYSPIQLSRVSVSTWIVREQVFLQGVRREGSDQKPDPVVAIEVTYKTHGVEPCGLTVLYQSGQSQTIGTRGQKSQTQTLRRDESLIRMEMGLRRGSRITYLSFTTNTGRKVDFCEDVSLRNPDSIHQRVIYELQRPAEVVADKGTAVDTPPGWENVACRREQVPEGAEKFVGFWATPKRKSRMLGYMMMGPTFTTKSAST